MRNTKIVIIFLYLFIFAEVVHLQKNTIFDLFRFDTQVDSAKPI